MQKFKHFSCACRNVFATYRAMMFSSEPVSRVLNSNPDKFLTFAKTPKVTFPKMENDYAHTVMEKQEKYNGYLANMNKIDTNKSPDIMKITSNQISDLNKENLSKTINNLCKTLPKMSDSEIEIIFPILKKTYSADRKEMMKNFITALDTECIRRLQFWDVRTCLRIADYFFHLNLSRYTSYNSKMISHLTEHMPSLNSSEIVQLLFYINIQRECNLKIMAALESKLIKCISQLSTEEISIAALAFFKTKNSLQSRNLFKLFQQRFISDISTLPETAVSSFGKLFRFTRIADLTLLMEVLDKSLPYIPKWNPTTCLNIGLITLSKELDHEEYVKSMALKFLNNLSDLRVKELSRLLTCVATYDYHFDFGTDFYTLIINELRKPEMQTQLMNHPVHLVSSLLSLAYHEIFPQDLLKQAMNADFVNLVEKMTKYGWRREYLVLDSAIQIELPKYSGPRLDPKTKFSIWKIDEGRIPYVTDQKLTMFEKTLLTVKYQLSDLLGGFKYATVFHVLPHFKLPDIVIHLDDKGHPLPTNHLNSSSRSYHYTSAANNVKSICFTLTGKSSYADNSKRRVAHVKMKQRQLKMLGYHVLEIPWFEYFAIPKTERLKYIEMKLSEVKNK